MTASRLDAASDPLPRHDPPQFAPPDTPVTGESAMPAGDAIPGGAAPPSRVPVPGAVAGFWFPGPWLGGVSLVVAPLLMLTGSLLRAGFPFFFPDQLAALHAHHALITLSYGTFLAGNIALWPAVMTLARLIGARHPTWAVCGASLVIFGLFARAFHYGANSFAFSVADAEGVGAATHAVADYYATPEWVVASLTGCIMLGWLVLAVGGFLSRTIRLVPALALALMSGLMIGVLKGSSWMSVVEVAGLVVGFVPVGVRVLRAAPAPSRRRLSLAILATVSFLAASVGFGQLG